MVLREEQIDFTNVVTTKKFCGKPRMTSEEAFLTTLKSTARWRLDDKSRLDPGRLGGAVAVDGRRFRQAGGNEIG